MLGIVALTVACDSGHHSAGKATGSASEALAATSAPAASAAAAPPTAPPANPTASAKVSTSATPTPSAKSVPPSTVAKPSQRPSAKPGQKAKPITTPSATTTVAAPRSASGIDVLPGTDCQIFPTDNAWHADIAALPVDPHSAQWLAAMGASTHNLHPDFGPSYGAQPVPYGIPITVVAAGQKRVPVLFDYADESDRLRYPLSGSTKIEDGAASDGDRHAVMVTADTCELFETWDTRDTSTGWTAGSGAHWSLSSDALRPDGWTSADAAGLPILPGLLRYDEVAAGHVDHAIRFTTNLTDEAHSWPARHDAGSKVDAALPPMGARFRLKAGFDIAGYSKQAQTILRAMQTYGLVLADNGSPWYFQGTADTAWPDALIAELKTIPASAFEAVDSAGLMESANSGAAR